MLCFLDCEFNGFGGELISLALAAEDGRELYLARPQAELSALDLHPWVAAHVVPRIDLPNAVPEVLARDDFAKRLRRFLNSDIAPVIVADWPEDIAHFMRSLILAPGQMILIPNLTTRLIHAPPWPEDLPEAVPHNALWDARALRHSVMRDRPPGKSSTM